VKLAHKWTLILFAVVVAGFLMKGFWSGVLTATPITLTFEVEQRLIDAPPTQGDGINSV